VTKAGLQRGRGVQVSLLLHFPGVSTDRYHERICEMMQKIFR
jgi:hypothetical protein